MLSFIVMYPAAAFTVAALMLVGIYYFVACGARCFIITLMVIALAPIWPVLALRLLGVWLVAFCDWLLHMGWAAPFAAAARVLESKLPQPRR